MNHLAPLYLSALACGLAGGFAHCIGMCGIFVVAYSGMPSGEGPGGGRGLGRHALFHAGRLVSLGLLGLIAGAIGSLAHGGLSHGWATAQSAVSLLAGAVMFALALGFSGVLPRLRIPEPDVMGAGGGKVRRAFLRVLQSRSALKPAGIGLFVGLLPCGLTYMVLVGAFALSPLSAATLMLCFGLGTIPGLLLLGLFGAHLLSGLLIRPAFRGGMTRFAAVLMGMLGLAFVWRGIGGL